MKHALASGWIQNGSRRIPDGLTIGARVYHVRYPQVRMTVFGYRQTGEVICLLRNGDTAHVPAGELRILAEVN